MSRLRRSVAAGGVALVLALAGCTSSSEGEPPPSVPGVTASTVTIGSTQPLSGIVAPGYAEISRGSAAYFEYVNDHGGINGRTIDYQYVDDRYQPKRAAGRTHSLVRKTKVFAMFNAFGTATHQRVVDFLNNEKVPDVFVGSGCPCWDDPTSHPYTFGWQPDYTVEGKILGDYVKHKYAGKKVALFFQDDDFGRAGVKGVEAVLPDKRIATKQSYRPTNPRISAQAHKLQSSGADVVIAFAVPAFTAILQLNMLKLHYSPKLVVSSAGSDPKTLSGLLTQIAARAGVKVKGGKLVQGLVTDGFLPAAGDHRNGWIQLFKRIHDQYLPTLPFDGNVVYGMAAAFTFADALRAAGPELTRDGLVSVIQGGLTPGPGLTPFGYSSTSHAGYTGAQVGVIKGGAISYVGKPMTTGDGKTPIRPYDQQPSEPPADGLPTG